MSARFGGALGPSPGAASLLALAPSPSRIDACLRLSPHPDAPLAPDVHRPVHVAQREPAGRAILARELPSAQRAVTRETGRSDESTVARRALHALARLVAIATRPRGDRVRLTPADRLSATDAATSTGVHGPAAQDASPTRGDPRTVTNAATPTGVLVAVVRVDQGALPTPQDRQTDTSAATATSARVHPPAHRVLPTRGDPRTVTNAATPTGVLVPTDRALRCARAAVTHDFPRSGATRTVPEVRTTSDISGPTAVRARHRGASAVPRATVAASAVVLGRLRERLASPLPKRSSAARPIRTARRRAGAASRAAAR